VSKGKKMPMRDQHCKPEANAASESSPLHPAIVLSFSKEKDAGLDMITRWINLSDRVLTKHENTRQKA
jgi:hypothetical protein